MKIKTKNAKPGVTSTASLALHKNLILKTPKREVKKEVEVEGSEKSYIWRDIMKGSHILFSESTAQSISLQISTRFFMIYSSGCNI